MNTYWFKSKKFGRIDGPTIYFYVEYDTGPDDGLDVGFSIWRSHIGLHLGYIRLYMCWWFK